MESHEYNPTKPNITFAKVVPNPTKNTWSQAYNAGGLFAVLALSSEIKENEEPADLNSIGRDVLNTLEEEFFTLEVKDLASTKDAIKKTLEKVPSSVEPTFIVASLPPGKEHVLYLFILGKGKVYVKRDGRLGNILTSSEELTSSSGYLDDKDTIVLATQTLLNSITVDTLSSSLDQSPPEAAEILAPFIHDKEEGTACAVIFSYHTPAPNPLTAPLEEEVVTKEKPEEPSNISIPDEEVSPITFKTMLPLQTIKKSLLSFLFSKKIFIGLAFIIICILAITIFLTIKNQENKKAQALFQTIYPKAESKYEEGQSLISLNRSLSKEAFVVAQKTLKDALPQFEKGSEEEKQITQLLQKIEKSLSEVSDASTAQAKSVNPSTSDVLEYVTKQPSGYVTYDDTTLYILTNSSVTSITRSNDKEKVLIKNDKSWDQAGGVGVYGTNIYILDKKNGGILKYVPTDSGYSKTNYLASGVTPDFSKAVSMAIENSAWVLYQDGTIVKYTRGKPDTFKLNGLDKPFVNPIRIYSHADINNIYVLDPGNSRIVVFNKEGAYQSQYLAPQLKSATEMEVQEKNKKIYFLSQKNVYQIDLR